MTGIYSLHHGLNQTTTRTAGSCSVDHIVSLMNLVEMISDKQHDAPCRHGNIVDGHACYCHSNEKDAPRKCPIWSRYGEHNLTRWRKDTTWENGCPYFETNKPMTYDNTNRGKLLRNDKQEAGT